MTGEKKWNGNISAKVWKFAFSEAVLHSALRKGEEKGEERENEKKNIVKTNCLHAKMWTA